MAKLWQYDSEDDSLWSYGNQIIGAPINVDSPVVWNASEDHEDDKIYFILSPESMKENDIRSFLEKNDLLGDDEDSDEDDEDEDDEDEEDEDDDEDTH